MDKRQRKDGRAWDAGIGLEDLPCAAFIWKFHEGDAYLLAANQLYRNQFLKEEFRENMPVLQDLLKAERQMLLDKLAHFTADRKAISYNRRAVRADGNSVWVRMDATYLDDLNGEPVYLSMLTDITEQVLLQTQIGELTDTVKKLQEERHRVYEAVPIGLASVQCEDGGRVTVRSANRMFFQIIGVEKEKLLESYGNELNQLNCEGAESLESLVCAGNVPCRWKVRRQDGSPAWVNMNLSAHQTKGWCFLSLTDISDLVGREEALAQREYYLSLLDRTTAGGILVRRADGHPEPLYMSKNIPRTLGYEYDELMDMLREDYMALLMPEEAERQRRNFKDVQYRMAEYTAEYPVRKKDGSPLWVYDNTLLERCPDGMPVYFSFLSDATQHKKDEECLKAREEEYRLAAAQSGKIVYRFNLANRSIDIPLDTAQSYKLPVTIENVPDSIIAEGYIGPESIEDCRAFYNAMLRGEPHGRVTMLSRRSAEEPYRWFLAQFTMVYASDGTPVSAVSMYEDVSEQREKEKLLKYLSTEQELLRAVAAHSGRTVFKYDIQMHTAYLGDKIAKEFGTESTIVGLNIANLQIEQVAKESQSEYLSFFQAIDRGESSGSTLIRRKNVSGQYIWFQADFTTILDERGKPDFAVVSFADVTDSYEMEVAYRQYQQEYTPLEPKSYTYYAFNLTQNRCDQERGRLLEHVRMQSDGTLDGLVQCIAEHFVTTKSEVDFRRFNNRAVLLQHYAAGKREDRLELLAVVDKKERWLLEKAKLFTDPYSGDVRCMFSFSDIDEKKREMESLLMRAEHDALTGLLNRSAFSERVKALQKSSDSLLGLLILEIDQFKAVNDLYGHIQGDQLLVELSQVIRSMLRPTDLLARLGGVEFVICLTNIPEEGLALRRAERICEKIKEKFAATFGITSSAGVAVFPKGGKSFEELYMIADESLIEAKKKGGNCCVYMGESELKNRIKERKAPKNRVFIRTFGYFDVFIDMVPLSFPSSKAKELLAVLVDRRGGILTSGEAISLLWEDDPQNQTTLARYRKVAIRLKKILEEAGIGNLLITKKDGRCVNVSQFNCDYYQYMDDSEGGKDLFHGNYMSNYSWAENTLATLLEIQEK